METIELLALVAAVLFCLAVLRRSTSPAVQVVRDPAVAHHLLNEVPDNKPNAGLFRALATWARGPGRQESITTAAYGTHWRSLRSNLTAGFLNPSRIAALAPLQRDAVEDLFAGLSASQGAGEVAIREHLDRAIFALAARMCFGDGMEEKRVRALQCVMEELRRAMDNTVSLDDSTLGKITHWRWLRRLLGVFVPLDELVRPLIAAARARNDSRHTAYMDLLVDLRVPSTDGGAKRALDDDEILGLVAEFMATNTGMIAACVEWTLANLVIQPEVQRKLRHEVDDEAAAGRILLSAEQEKRMPYMRAVVLESLRMHPPSPFVTRGVHDVTTGGLRKRFIFILRDIGRHGSAWTEPDRFRTERFLPGGEAEEVGHMPGRSGVRMMPFGGGRRFCPGAGLAILHVKIFLVALVRRFELSCGGAVDLTGVGGFNNVMKKPLRVRLTPRTLP
ncbi:unnamed protein product [Alopecurus aequalis]